MTTIKSNTNYSLRNCICEDIESSIFNGMKAMLSLIQMENLNLEAEELGLTRRWKLDESEDQ